MNLDEFKRLHSETICYCQILENDLKWIYSFITNGNATETRKLVNNLPLGETINILKRIDKKNKKHLFSNEDYKYLMKLKNRRNYWSHQCYVDFLYKDSYLYSEQYKKCCDDLISDHDWFLKIYKIVENIKVDFND